MIDRSDPDDAQAEQPLRASTLLVDIGKKDLDSSVLARDS